MPAYALIAETDPGQAQLYRHIAAAEGLEVKKVLAASQAPHGPAPSHSAPPPGPAVIEIDEERAEELRLHRLDEMQLIDEGDHQDQELRKIVEETARKFGTPIAAITLVLED